MNLVRTVGLTLADALRSATANPAAFFGLDRELGAIRPGYHADLVLLNANPIDDIIRTREIAGVVRAGRWLDRAALDALLARAAAEARPSVQPDATNLMSTAILGAIGAVIVWLALELLGSLVGESLWLISGPLRRPIWRSFVRARWPWPLLLLLVAGTGVAAVGLPLAVGGEPIWQMLGAILFLGGAFAAVASPFVWRDARRERTSRAGELNAARPARQNSASQ